ncbi:MAG TPA: hypothetical protein VN802_08480 [Stellaceae bacterium]|nr:hypothetical protein [Stellaceae bacterium]
MTVQIPITIACGDYDRTRALKDGRVPVEGCDVTYIPLEPEEVFFRAFRYQEFDVCELSFSSYLRITDSGESAYIGIPAFVSRVFRHSGIYIRTDRGIKAPRDLIGKTIGLPEYQITAVVWMRGILQDEYGVKPTDIHWRSGGIEQPGRDERTPLAPIPGLDLKPIPSDKTLSGMLASGEIDAMFSARALLLRRGRSPCRSALPRLPCGREGVLREDRALSHHAPDRREEEPGRAPSLAADQPLQGLCRSQGAGVVGGA